MYVDISVLLCFISWPFSLATMKQALRLPPAFYDIFRVIFLPVIEFGVAPAAAWPNRLRHSPSVALSEFLVLYARSYLAAMRKVSDKSPGSVQVDAVLFPNSITPVLL